VVHERRRRENNWKTMKTRRREKTNLKNYANECHVKSTEWWCRNRDGKKSIIIRFIRRQQVEVKLKSNKKR